MNAIDLVAKLLATENLTVVRSKSKTAYFDLKSRVLNLPMWKDMNEEIEGMLVAHEVGHALYTSTKDWMDAAEDRVLIGYVNVVEDARIEKFMKRRYPGIRKTFNTGYKELMSRDFFKLKERDLNSLLPIDKLNLFFKAGYSAGIKLNTIEKEFCVRMENVETFEEVLAISRDILEYTRSIKRDVESESDQDISFNPDYDDEDAEYDYEESDEEEELETEAEINSNSGEEPEENEEEGKTVSGSEGNNDLESETDRNLNESLTERADDSTEYRYFDLIDRSVTDPFVSYKQIIAETTDIEVIAQQNNIEYRQEFDKFMIESERMVAYLVKEFEMRKSAQAYRRTKIAKSGSLNMNKLHAYKINDDIFKRIAMVPNGKNHGMVFLLDWSGSMTDVIIPTIKQVINLAMFCRRINIPFEVYAFSGSYFSRRTSTERYETLKAWNYALAQQKDNYRIWSDNYFTMLNLFSSKMSMSEFKTIARRFTTKCFQYCAGYSLGDTPLNEALLEMVNFIPKFKKQNNIEKLTFITLTDGQGGNLLSTKSLSQHDYVDGKHIKVRNFIRDSKTGKDYAVTNDSCTMTESLIRIIKDRYDVTTLGFYIVPNRRRYIECVYMDHFGKRGSWYEIEQMRKDFKNHGFSSLKGTGRDDLFIIPDSSTKIIDSELEVDANASAAAIARKFGKMFNTKKHSRVLLDKFIGYVA